jgi:hypothetical protein
MQYDLSSGHNMLDTFINKYSTLEKDLLEILPGSTTMLCYLTFFQNSLNYIFIYFIEDKIIFHPFSFILDTNSEVPKRMEEPSVIIEANSFREKFLKKCLNDFNFLTTLPDFDILLNLDLTNIVFLAPSSLMLFPFEYTIVEYFKSHSKTINISHAPSLNFLLNRIKLKNKKVLIIPYLGDDLAFVKSEIDFISSLDFLECNVLDLKAFEVADGDLSAISSKFKLLSEMNNSYDIIHIVGHGHYMSIDPANSKLIISISNNQHIELTANILENLSFENTSPIIFLSGCSTGLNSFDGYNSFYGISGSFFTAGAAAVIGTRWNVYDEVCKDFSVLFYTNIQKMSPNIAFNSAILELEKIHTGIENCNAFVYFGSPF